MEPDEYRNHALAIAAATAATVRAYFGFLPANPDDGAWRRFISLIYPEVMRGRLDTFNLSTEFYDSLRPADAAPGPDYVERTYPESSLSKGLAPARARLVGVDELVAEEQRLAAEQAEAITAEHVMAAGRENVEDASNADTDALGWVRVPSGAETCAFCTMLVSRGPVFKTTRRGDKVVRGLYRSERSALFGQGGEPYHPNCDCIAVPVFDAHDWPGREHYVEAQRLWYETTGGKSGRDALNALRRHLYAQSAS